MSSWRTRLRGMRDVGVASRPRARLAARGEIRAQRVALDLEQRTDRRGRRCGRMLASPRVPAPRSSRSRNVSAWSSCVCATAMTSAPSASAARSKKRVARPPRGVLDRSLLRARQRGDVGPLGANGTPSARRERGAERLVGVGVGAAQAVIADAPRRRPSARPSASSSRRRNSSATESAPPDSATSTRAARRAAARGGGSCRRTRLASSDMPMSEMLVNAE